QRSSRVKLCNCQRVNTAATNETPTNSDSHRWLAKHATGLLLIARQRSGSEADARELVQDSVVGAWRRQVDGEPPPLALVVATIRRRAIERVRSRERRTRRELAAGVLDECWLDTNAEDRERVRVIQDAMSQLSDMYREVITLKIWGELTFAEIAEAL